MKSLFVVVSIISLAGCSIKKTSEASTTESAGDLSGNALVCGNTGNAEYMVRFNLNAQKKVMSAQVQSIKFGQLSQLITYSNCKELPTWAPPPSRNNYSPTEDYGPIVQFQCRNSSAANALTIELSALTADPANRFKGARFANIAKITGVIDRIEFVAKALPCKNH